MASGPSGSANAFQPELIPGGSAAAARAGTATGISPVWGFIVRRLLLGILVLVLVSIVVFVATQALGDPARAILGRSATPASLAALREQLHLNQPVVAQYFTWAGGLLHGDAGNSLAAQEPVTKLIGDRIVNSAVLVLCAGLISIPLSVAIGSYARCEETRHSTLPLRSARWCSLRCPSSWLEYRWWSSSRPPFSISCLRSR